MADTIDFSAQIEGLTTLILGGKTLVKFTRDFTTVWQRIASDFRIVQKKNYDSEGFPEKFTALWPKYLRWKIKQVGKKPIMQFSGRLMNSLIGKTSDTIEAITPRSLRIGTKVPYAIDHKQGNKVFFRPFGVWIRLPIRKPIQITGKDSKRWFTFFEEFLRFQLKNRIFPAKGVL